MFTFFEYNWQVRDEWFDWGNELTHEELLKERRGGVGNILYTLFHIVDVEYSWIRAIQGKEDIVFPFEEDYHTLEKVKSLSDTLRSEIVVSLKTNVEESKDKPIHIPWDEGEFTKDEILHHIIAHEIHHIGQLSVWARDLDRSPVSANFIGRNLKAFQDY